MNTETKTSTPEGVTRARVVLADDHQVVRDGISRVLEDEDIVVAGVAEDGAHLLQVLKDADCHLIVLDLSLPDYTGFELIARLTRDYPALPILVLSMYPEQQYGPGALRAGARGYLTKGCSGVDLCAAIRRVIAGESLPLVAVPENNRTSKLPHEHLSEREWQVFLLIAAGKTPSEVGSALELGSSTISTYLSRIRTKLGAESLGEIIRYALQHRLSG